MKILLSFEDVLLYQDDLLCLTDGQWITDKIIEFHFATLQNKSIEARFIPPNICHLLSSLRTSQYGEFIVKEALEHATLYFAINNAEECELDGTHWTLLVISGCNATHYDSMNSLQNKAKAQKITHSIGLFRSLNPLKCNLSIQQRNGFDCGIYVCWFAECLALNQDISHPPRDYRKVLLNRIHKLMVD